MMHKSVLVVMMLSLLTVPAASAQSWYLGAFGGYSDTDDTAFETALGTVTTTFDSGVSWGLFLGYDTSRVRFEAELSMREGEVSDHILGGDALPGPTGESRSLAVLGNLIYDFNRDGAVQPYIGAGLGWTDVEFDNFGVAPIPDVLKDSDSSLAYQLLAGIGIPLGDKWDLFLDYRWFAADSLSLTVSEAAGAVSSDVDYEVQDIAVGLRFSF
jgi:opacity protein-like surface antigen